MRLRRTLALVGAVSATVFAACKEPPFAPRWDADMYMPLSAKPIALAEFVPAPPLNVIPPGGVPVPDSFPPQSQSVSGVLGDLLKNLVTDPARCSSVANPALSCDLLTLAVTKPAKGFAVQDTLFVASAINNLNVAGPGTIVFPLTLTATDVTKTDSVYLTQSSVSMLQSAGQTTTPLWIQLRGHVSNPGASPITITSADSIHATLSVTVRVAVVHK
jgi:hypothetical protein